MIADLSLNDGNRLPALGFGLYKVAPEQVDTVVRAGLDAGYRLIDGASFYGNEQQLGEVLRASEADGVTVTSKAWCDPVQSYAATLAEFAETERMLGAGLVDVYLIHWPRASKGHTLDVWRALIDLQAAGRVRTIGVANFNEAELTQLIDETGVVPAINQVELHPWLPQRALRDFHERHGIVTQAWSPLGRGRLLTDPAVASLADSLGATPAQVVIGWHLQSGHALVPKSANPSRLAENLAAEQVVLTPEAMAALGAIESGMRTGTDPKDRR